MWTQASTDAMVLHAQNEVSEALGKFITVYLGDRLPTAEEISQGLNIPVEDVAMALAMHGEESD